jgi:acyl-CoA thioesterase YciA
MSERNISIRRILLPKDTNYRGEVFGGAILAEIDLAGAVEARRHTRHDVATVAVKEVQFLRPVAIGDVITFWTSLVKKGTTSITVKVEVEATRDTANDGEVTSSVTCAEVVYVAIAPDGKGGITKVPLVGEVP